MRQRIRPLALAVVATAAFALVPATAQADDHLFNASTSSGASERGFTNPVAGNPSGTSGPAAQPSSVPGLGDPKVGEDTGTPAFGGDALCERVQARSEGTPATCG